MMMGAICSAVSLRTLAGSSSGPVALFWFRFFSCNNVEHSDSKCNFFEKSKTIFFYMG